MISSTSPAASEEFSSWLRKGLGRTILNLRAHAAAGTSHLLRDSVLHACLHHLAYDKQCESRREQYLFDLIQTTGEPGWYREALLSALGEPSEEKDLWQVIGILRRFAEIGDKGARDAIYRAFDENVTGENMSDAEELIVLDGMDGFLHAVSLLEGRSPEDEQSWQFDVWVEALEDREGKRRARRALSMAAEGNPTLDAWLTARKLHRRKFRAQQAAWSPPPTVEFDNILGLVGESAPLDWRDNRFKLRSAGRRASPEALEQAAEALRRETDPAHVTRWIQLFGTAACPGDPAAILQRIDVEDDNLQFDAALALSHVAHPDVRARALELAAIPGRETDFASLLEANFQPEDEPVMHAVLLGPLEDEILHSIVSSIRRIQERQSLSQELLTQAYERTPCSLCRGAIARALLKSRQLTSSMREECLWDADEQTRKQVRDGTALTE